MLRLHTGVNADAAEHLLKLLVTHRRKLKPRNGTLALVQYPQLLGYGYRRIDVVARYHYRSDSGSLALLYRRLDLRAHGVYHPAQPHKAELLLKILRCSAFGGSIPTPFRTGKDSQRPVRHRLVCGKYLLAVFLGHGNGLTVLKVVFAAVDNYVGSALCKLNDALVRTVQGTHHLAPGVEGGLHEAGRLLLDLGLFKPQRRRPLYERRLRRLAADLSVFRQLGVAAQRHGCGKTLLVAAEEVRDRHFVLRERTRFVGADYLSAAESFDRSQTADYRIALGHIGDADGQHHCHDRRKAFGYRSDRKGDGNHERIQHGFKLKASGSGYLHGKHGGTDAQHEVGQHTAKLVELYLQGCLPLLRLRKGVGDPAHLGIHTRCADDHDASAINDGRTHIRHVRSVAERHLASCGERIRRLVNGDRLACQSGFLDLQACAFDYPAVCGNGVARFEQHHVAGDEVLAVNGVYCAAAHDL